MWILAAALIAASLLVALLLVTKVFGTRSREREREASAIAKPGERSCPLCSSVLKPGERVSSKLFPGKGNRIMHIFGCAHCWPATPSAPRICPVCTEALDPEGWVIARYFERPAQPGQGQGRRHIHVLGCTRCRG